MPLPLYDLATAAGAAGFNQRLAVLRGSVSSTTSLAASVADIIAEVAQHGDDAIVKHERKWTDPNFDAGRIRVSPDELADAARKLDPALRATFERTIANVRAYQRHIRPSDPPTVELAGATLGLRFSAVGSAGLIVPGGRASYPSTVIMLAVPAIEAGVPLDRIGLVSPGPTRRAGEPAGDISPLVLAVCHMLGVTRVYRIGGAAGVAALALGTKSVEPVDMIAGPGHPVTQLAKAQLAGRVGIDGFYGPSEIVAIADDSADAGRVASDLLAQAEHDPGLCFLVSWSRAAIERVQAQIEAQTATLSRQAAVEQSFANCSAAVLVRDEAEAVAVADAIAAEHVNLAVADPMSLLKKLRHGGEFFLGDATPVAAGDYVAGPSHTLPTGTTARFSSGVSVYTFLKRSGTVWYRDQMPAQTIADIAAFAAAEGLDAHARSAMRRQR
jgi:histidinol dehydrogenase